MSFVYKNISFRGEKVVRNFRTLWRNDNYWFLKDSPSNDVQDRKIGVGRGGIALCLHPRMQFLVNRIKKKLKY
jgi:hypothetical protein